MERNLTRLSMNMTKSDKTKPNRKKSKTRVISVTSGKGGVGKTITSVNLAMAAQRMGLKVLILDGDFGLANVDVVLGLQARYNIRDVLDGHAKLKDIVVEGPLGLKIIPSGSGIANLTRLSSLQKQVLFEQVHELEAEFDVLIIDTGAGIGDQVTDFNCAAQDIIVVTTPEPHAMTDAYALIKVLNKDHKINKFNILVNMVRSDGEGTNVSERIADVANRYLGIGVSYLGCIPHDQQIQRSILSRSAASERLVHTLAGQAWNRVSHNLFSNLRSEHNSNNGDFWQRLLWTQSQPHPAEATA